MSVAAFVVHVAVAPALPLHTAGKYVAGAYIVFVAMILIYVSIMATRLARTERELTDLTLEVQRRREASSGADRDSSGLDRTSSGADRDEVNPGGTDRDREPVA